jgi:hypothetical protein
MGHLMIELFLMKIKNNTVQPLFKNYNKTIHSLIDRRLRAVELVYEGNNTGLKKLSCFV